MSKVIGRAEKLERKFLRSTVNGVGRWILFQSLLKNAFDSAHVQQFETQCPFTGLVEPFGAVAFRQTQQLLSLAQTTPWKLTPEKFLGETARMLPQFLSFLAIVVRPPHGERGPLFRIIGIVGGTFPGDLARMCFDELATVVDSHQ